MAADALVNLRIEHTNDGREAVIADISGGSRVFFGYLDAEAHLKIDGSDRVAKSLVP